MTDLFRLRRSRLQKQTSQLGRRQTNRVGTHECPLSLNFPRNLPVRNRPKGCHSNVFGNPNVPVFRQTGTGRLREWSAAVAFSKVPSEAQGRSNETPTARPVFHLRCLLGLI